MTKTEFIISIQNEILRLQKTLDQESCELDFYDSIFSCVIGSSITQFSDVPSTDFLIAFLNASIPEKTFEEIQEEVLSFSQLLENFSSFDINIINQIMSIIVDSGKSEKAKNAFSDTNKRRGIRLLKGILDLDAYLACSSLKDLLLMNHCDNCNIVTLIEYYEDYSYQIIDGLVLVSILKKMKQEEAELNDAIDQSDVNIRNRDRKKILQQQREDSFNLKSIQKEINSIKNYYHDLSQKIKSEKKACSRKIRGYTDFLEKFPKVFQQDEITNYEQLLKKLSNPEIRFAFLEMVYQHNCVEDERLECSLRELSSNSTVSFLALLKDYGISKDEVVLSKIMKRSYEEVASMLLILKSFIPLKEFIIYALEVSSIQQISRLKEYNTRGILISETLAQYPSLFLEDSLEFQSFQKNVSILEEHQFNASRVAKTPEVLIENAFLEENLSILEEYNLLRLWKNGDDYRYLGRADLRTQIDSFLELGLESFLLEDLSLLNEEHLDRLRVLKAAGFTFDSKEEVLSILRKDTFIVSDDEIKNYIPNVTEFYQKKGASGERVSSIPRLEGYEKTPLTYEVGGILFSKNKVLRNYSFGNLSEEEALFQALIQDTVLSADEVSNLLHVIQGKIYQK